METRQGKIEKKAMAFAKNGAPYATFTIDGKNYNTFDAKIVDAHNPDDFVEFTGEQEDRFWVLKTMKIIDEKDAFKDAYVAPKAANGKEYHLSPEEVKCRALECAIECGKAKIMNIAGDEKYSVLDMADKFVEWIRNGN